MIHSNRRPIQTTHDLGYTAQDITLIVTSQTESQGVW